MTDTIWAAIIGASISLISTVLTLVVNAFIENYKIQVGIQQKQEEVKRDKLIDIYMELLSIINSYPNESPNNVLENTDYSPHYSMESFDSIVDTLNYQIEDYERLLGNTNVAREEKEHNKTQIRKREYAIERITKIKEDYYNARDSYKTFCKEKKMMLDLYAGQEVLNYIVEFDVLIQNIFISGYKVSNVYDLRYNEIEVIRTKIVKSIRNDIGLN